MQPNETYNVEFLRIALNDIDEVIASFIMLGSKQGAERIKAKFIKAAKQIQQFPYSGITVPDKKMTKSGFRMIIVENYLMFYKVFDDERKIIFYRVLNGKTNYPTMFSKEHNYPNEGGSQNES